MAFYLFFSFKAWAPYRFNKKCMLNCQIVRVLCEEEALGAKDLMAFCESADRKTLVIVHC